MDLNRKIELAIKLLQSIPQDGPIELSYSGGKDSDVILELAKMAGIPFEAIYKNTTIDPPGTIKHCKDMGVTIRQPQKTMFELIELNGWPSRWSRFCCKFLKEYKIYDRNIIGIRRSESLSRAKRYKEPEQCRVYPNGEKERIYLPILEWTDNDVVEFIKMRSIKCAPVYYDKSGNFHVEQRLGCVGCPLASGNGRKDFEKYPKMLKQWIKHYQIWWDTHPNTKSKAIFNNVYEKVFFNLFCTSMEEFKTRIGGGIFPEQAIDAKQFLESHFGIEL